MLVLIMISASQHVLFLAHKWARSALTSISAQFLPRIDVLAEI